MLLWGLMQLKHITQGKMLLLLHFYLLIKHPIHSFGQEHNQKSSQSNPQKRQSQLQKFMSSRKQQLLNNNNNNQVSQLRLNILNQN